MAHELLYSIITSAIQNRYSVRDLVSALDRAHTHRQNMLSNIFSIFNYNYTISLYPIRGLHSRYASRVFYFLLFRTSRVSAPHTRVEADEESVVLGKKLETPKSKDAVPFAVQLF